MTNELNAALAGALIGGVIALFSGWLLPKIQESRNLKQRRKFFTTAIIDDLNSSTDLYEKVKEGWDKTQTIWFEYTIEIKERRKIYQKYLENVLLYPDDIRKELTNYYIKTGKLVALLEAQQNRIYYLVNQYSDKLKDIKNITPQISDVDAQNTVFKSLQNESKETANIISAITANVNDLRNFTRDVKDLVSRLNKIIK